MAENTFTIDTRPGVMGIHSSRAVDYLKTGTPGDTVTREKMAEIIGRPCGVNSLGYGNVTSAIRHVEHQFRIVWRWCRDGKVWKCLDDSERVGVLQDDVRIARKRINRGIRAASTADVSKLSLERKRELGIAMAAAGVMSLCGGSSFAKRLEKISTPHEPDASKLIELMNGKT